MSSRRLMILLIALGLAGVTAVATFRYASAADARARGDAELVQVFMVKKDLAKGFPGERALQEGYIKQERIPRKFHPEKAVVDAGSLQGKVALGPMVAGLPVVEGSFVEPRSARESFAQRIEPGKQAVTLSLNDVQGVARLIVPGDRVNMMMVSGDGEEATTQFVLQGIEVLAVGNSTQLLPGEAPLNSEGPAGQVETLQSGLVTFAVPGLDAERLVHASTTGSVHLTLVPPDTEPTPIPPVNRANLFS